MRSGTASPLPEANSRARKQSQMVRTIASSSNGAWRYVTCSSSLLFDGEDGSLPAQPNDNAFDEQSELTYASPPGYRESGSPEVLPLHTPHSASTTSVAISSQSQTNNYYRTRQDVHFPVNSSASSLSSTVPRPTAQSAQPLESPLSSYHSQHVSINSPNNRPRTSSVFVSTTDLANHYGIPTILPPAPRTTPRRPPQPEPQSTEYPDFAALSANYLNMLKSTPDANSATADTTSSAMDTINPAALSSPVGQFTDEDFCRALRDVLEGELLAYHDSDDEITDNDSAAPPTPNTSPAMPPSPEFDEFLTSASPYTPYTPFEDDIDTPLFADVPMLTGPLISGLDDNMDLFGGVQPESSEKSSQPVVPPLPDHSQWYTMSPDTPLLDLAPASYPSPALDSSKPIAPPPRRKSTATGTRKNITPDTLVPLDAPTQPRKYITPSVTSRKEVPATFLRKRGRSQAFNDDDEMPEDAPGPNATEKEQIEWKRRQNTLAARKSRKRKLEHQQQLEDQVQALSSDREKWKTRALMLQNMLHSHGIPFAQFED
nr:bZIP transcription factor [Pleurotus ostreatus]